MSGRIRTIKPETLEDAVTAGLSHEGFRLFIGLILLVDDWGNAVAEPAQLHGRVFHSQPLPDAGVGVERLLIELARDKPGDRPGLIELYVVRGQKFLTVTNWFKHQYIDRPSKPRIPTPVEAATRTTRQRYADRLVEYRLANHAALADLPREARATLASVSRAPRAGAAKSSRKARGGGATVSTPDRDMDPGSGTGKMEGDLEAAPAGALEEAPAQEPGPVDGPGPRTTRVGAKNQETLDSMLARARDEGADEEALARIGTGILAAAEARGAELGEQTILGYFKVLESFSQTEVEEAFERARAEIKFLPSAAELRTYALEARKRAAADAERQRTTSEPKERSTCPPDIARTFSLKRSAYRRRPRGHSATVRAIRAGQIELPLPDRDDFIDAYGKQHESPLEHIERLYDGLANGSASARLHLVAWAEKYMERKS